MVRLSWGPRLVVLACMLTSCRGESADAGNRIDVKLADFTIHLSTAATQSGPVTLRLINDGPSTHEVNVDLTSLDAGSLPLRADGLSVAEDSPELKRIDAVEIVEAGDSTNLKLDLPPGHYVLYCNLEGHYLGKMYATLDVN